jgi:hypothetical protein
VSGRAGTGEVGQGAVESRDTEPLVESGGSVKAAGTGPAPEGGKVFAMFQRPSVFTAMETAGCMTAPTEPGPVFRWPGGLGTARGPPVTETLQASSHGCPPDQHAP